MDGAVAEVFERMLQRGCSAMPGPCAIETDVSARIRFSGAIESECVLEFPSASAHRLTEAFLGSADTEWDESLVADTVGELCNMVAGGWKKRLGKSAWGADLSVPVLTRGSDPSVSDALATTMRRVYVFDDSPFAVRLTIV